MALNREHYHHMLAAQLAKARERRGWTQAEAARRAGCNQSTISRVENGKLGIDMFQVIDLGAIYGVSLSEMMRRIRDAKGTEEGDRPVIDRGFFGE